MIQYFSRDFIVTEVFVNYEKGLRFWIHKKTYKFTPSCLLISEKHWTQKLVKWTFLEQRYTHFKLYSEKKGNLRFVCEHKSLSVVVRICLKIETLSTAINRYSHMLAYLGSDQDFTELWFSVKWKFVPANYAERCWRVHIWFSRY